MKNEILEELWKAKDDLSEEYGNNIDALAKALIEKEKNDPGMLVDLSHNKTVAA